MDNLDLLVVGVGCAVAIGVAVTDEILSLREARALCARLDRLNDDVCRYRETRMIGRSEERRHS